MLVVSSTLLLAACGPRGALDGPGLNIPGPPEYLRPAKVWYGTAETDARELALQRRRTIEDLNSRITKGRAAWLKMQKGAARKK